MHHFSTVALALAAASFEALAGYPQPVYRAIGHPVTWMGNWLDRLDRALNRESDSFEQRRQQGMAALAVLLVVSGGLAGIFAIIAGDGWLGVIIVALAASSMIAQRSLHAHVLAVADALRDEGLEGGRRAVSMIVGRNPEMLDEAGVARAAIESLAENFSDGVVAPTFWLALAGFPGAVLYKATNTADSMIGHRTPRYEAFGWAAARLDDLLNLPASRLSAVFLILAARVTGVAWDNPWLSVRRDAPRHRSPNAGWPEAAMAGALGLQLGGPRVYGDTLVDDAFMGDGRREATADDIDAALRLYRTACGLQWLTLAVLTLIV
ncbi:MAG TPA: adenosylcobinamide-phosphate synthase CbiB [Alphaproteobacteria bacterium]|nr:adenosylcobinamide-phosphate synthase CbiB [Alphaproteobacteria bacterium]